MLAAETKDLIDRLRAGKLDLAEAAVLDPLQAVAALLQELRLIPGCVSRAANS